MTSAEALLMWSEMVPVPDCHYCGVSLDLRYNYACTLCQREVCDNDTQACQEEDCDMIACFNCIDSHMETNHLDPIAFG